MPSHLLGVRRSALGLPRSPEGWGCMLSAESGVLSGYAADMGHSLATDLATEVPAACTVVSF
jgi:hypothetical protein